MGLAPADFDLACADLLAEQAAPTTIRGPANGPGELAHSRARRSSPTSSCTRSRTGWSISIGFCAAPDHGDEALARQALVEGEAVALSHDLGLRREGRDFAALPDVADLAQTIRSSATGPVLARAPAFVRTMLTFPYASGVGFVHAFRQRHPWAALSTVYRDPPRSSAQILHPERYLDRREDPRPVPLPDLTPLLPAGSRLAIDDELGEVGVAEVLRRPPGEAGDAAGWRGDRYALWDVAPQMSALVAVIVWDTEDQAAQFTRAYAPVLARKHGLAALPPDSSLLTWSGATTAFAIERRRRTVLLCEGVPAPTLDAVRAAVWSKPVLY
jgi:hypothetical protein